MVKNLFVYNKTKIKIDGIIVHSVFNRLLKYFNVKLSNIEITFLNAPKIHKLNAQFLNHDYSTDILTFNYTGDTQVLDGEIFISTDDAIENAKKYKCSNSDELLRLLVHGFLHLIGYDDINPEDKKIMKRVENKLVKKLNSELKKDLIKNEK